MVEPNPCKKRCSGGQWRCDRCGFVWDLNVSVENGKYTIVQNASGELYALRHGEKWRDLCGDGMVYALAAEIENLRQKIEDAKNCLACTAISNSMEVCENTLNILNDTGGK